jgi:hypothetical protein
MADEDKKAPATAAAEPTVILAVIEPNDLFDLTGQGLPNVTREGTAYKQSDADRVLGLARRYNVPVVKKEKS